MQPQHNSHIPRLVYARVPPIGYRTPTHAKMDNQIGLWKVSYMPPPPREPWMLLGASPNTSVTNRANLQAVRHPGQGQGRVSEGPARVSQG